MQEIDLLIIGSGPAGLSVALHLQQQDSNWAERLILVEKASHPRPKLCAGGVTRIGLETLRDLDIQLQLPIPGVEVEEVRLIYRGRQIRVSRKPVFIVYNRIEFDTYLSMIARERGVKLHEDEAVLSVTNTGSGLEVETTRTKYLAQVVVGADGSKGFSRKYLSRGGATTGVARALEAVYPVTPDGDPESKLFALFDFTWCEKDLQGYYWEFPSLVRCLPHTNLGVYDARLVSSRKRADLPEILEHMNSQTNRDLGDIQVQGHPVLWFNPMRSLTSPRFLVVGDAAGVDSLFGEGIGPALAYGKLAAREIQSAFEVRDFSFRRYKVHLLVSPLGRYLTLRWFIAWISYHLSWNAVYMHILWTLGMLAAALWKESRWFYRPYSAQEEAITNDQE